MNSRTWPMAGLAVLVVTAGCGQGGEDPDGAGRPTIVVTTSILGDVVSNIVGDDADVVIVMPIGASPHDFQASAQQVNQIRDADALIANGGGFEEGLADVIDSAASDGVPTFEALRAVAALEADDHDEQEGADLDGEVDDESDHDGGDPHFFTDPVRMSEAVDGITGFLGDVVPSLDQDALTTRATGYQTRLADLDESIESLLSGVENDRRVLVTNHEVFAYFADRYGFEVIGTVIPGGSTSDGASAGALAALAALIEEQDVPAIFADTSSPARLAETLAREVGDVDVVVLFSESLGRPGSGGETYLDMMRTNAERIAAALE